MSYATYGKLRFFSPWKVDISNFGHGLEALIVSAGLTALIVGGSMVLPLAPLAWRLVFVLASFFMLAHYWGREKRDCETGMGLPAGSPKAWLFMWWRPKNILDMIGPIVVHTLGWLVWYNIIP